MQNILAHFNDQYDVEKNFQGVIFKSWTPKIKETISYSSSQTDCSNDFRKIAMHIVQASTEAWVVLDRHYPKLHQMVNNGTSRALIHVIRCQITLRVFFISKKSRKMTIWSKKTQKCWCSWKKIFEKLHASHQSWKKKCSDIIHSKLMNLIIHSHF